MWDCSTLIYLIINIGQRPFYSSQSLRNECVNQARCSIYLPVNELSVCHPHAGRQAGRQAGSGPFCLERCSQKRRQIWGHCSFVRYFLWLMPFLQRGAGAHIVIMRTIYNNNSALDRPVHGCSAVNNNFKEKKRKKSSINSTTMQMWGDNRLLTYGCTVRRHDLQAEQNKSQVEAPHRHLRSNARPWHCC